MRHKINNLRPSLRASFLEEWFSDPRSDKYFGRGFALRAAVLAHVISGKGTLAEIARAHQVSKQALTRHARLARQVFELGQPAVDSK